MSKRSRVAVAAAAGAVEPACFDYADPPYPGMAWMYKDQATYEGEVDHSELIAGLALDYARGRTLGFALSTSSKTLKQVLALVPFEYPELRVMPWVKPTGVSGEARGPYSRWEPLIVVGGRKMRPGIRDWAEDVLRAKPASGSGADLVGAKPLAFCAFLFDMLGMVPGDELRDLFPGTGVVSRAWAELSTRATAQLELLPSLVAGARRPVLQGLLSSADRTQ